MFEASSSWAQEADLQDVLAGFRQQFFVPRKDGREMAYFCGNSLGLQPKNAPELIKEELQDWANYGVDGHFESRRPWFRYHHFFKEKTAQVVGALPSEVVTMNGLTVNLHLMMVSFYRPTPQRYKILMEGSAFPSDRYAAESQTKFHGFDPEEAIIEVLPRPGEHTLRPEDILEAIDQNSSELALILIGGVNYLTGQFFDLEAIARAGTKAGAVTGFDLAHAAGNVPLRLHDWGADFAVWCNYKYLNSGPGAIASAFVHQKHENNPDLPRFAGWWGYEEATRFEMKPGFKPSIGADGWQMSNAPVLGMAANLASLDLFAAAGMDRLRQKSLKLTGFLEFLLKKVSEEKGLNLQIITPKNPDQRGCQLSLLTGPDGKQLFNKLAAAGIVADWREPGVIRMAPVPLYNSFADVYRVYEGLSN